MKKIFHLFVFVTVFLSFWGTSPARAGGNEQSLALQEGLPEVFALSQLGYVEKLMVGPYDSASVNFSLPPNIELASGSSFVLKYALTWSGGASKVTDLSGVGGTLLVYFNDELIDTIILTADAPLEKEILIPDSALNKKDPRGRHNLKFFLNSELNCTADGSRATVTVSKSSQLNFKYKEVSPVVDLALLPGPIYHPDSILPSSAFVVVPDNAEAFELQAAFATMTGFGAATAGEMNIHLITNSQLTQELVSTNHLIFVGLAKNFPNLQVVNFPMEVSGSGLALDAEYETDGVVQISLSPWSPAHAVMFVGGNSEDAVLKAGQALSTGNIIAVEKPDFSLIRDVNPLGNVPNLENQTFKDLGYEDESLGLYGENYLEYIFYASPDQADSEGAYVDLVLSHSELINFDQTGITLILNDEVIGGVKLTEESPATNRVNLVPGVLRRGFNRLEIVSDVVPHFSCYSEDLLSTAVTISNTSTVHLPVSETKLDVDKNVNLRDFPYMFLDSRDLGNLAIILPSNDPVSWNYASLIAFNIGATGNVPLANFHVMYGDDVPEDVLKDYNLLVVGLPSAIPFYSKLNESLPAPIEPGSDEAIQPAMLVNYSLLPDTSVGYLQLLPSPWNANRAILTVSGNTTDGIPMAGNALLTNNQTASLIGNFAIVYFDQIVTTDTRLGLAKEGIVSQLPVAVTVTPAVTTSSPQNGTNLPIEEQPAWILPLVGGVTVVILILLLVMLRREASVRKTTARNTKPRDESSEPGAKTS